MLDSFTMRRGLVSRLSSGGRFGDLGWQVLQHRVCSGMGYYGRGKVWQPSTTFFPVCTTLGSWSGLLCLTWQVRSSSKGWAIDATATGVGMRREVWSLRCTCSGSDKILAHLTSPDPQASPQLLQPVHLMSGLGDRH